MAWTCPHCGGTLGQPFADSQLRGMLCLAPDCGRFDAQVAMKETDEDGWDASDF